MRIRFTLRAALLLMMFVSIGLAIVAYVRHAAMRRLRAIAQIEHDSGFVGFRNADGGIPGEIDNEVRLRDRAETISLAQSKLSQRTLDLLHVLKEVQRMSFNSSEFSDAHVRYLDPLVELRDLQLNGTKISADGLAHLARKHQLTMLTLNDTAIGDEAVEILATMKSLRKLHLHGVAISKEGMQELRLALPKCRIWPDSSN
jgi:hypothetical protein